MTNAAQAPRWAARTNFGEGVNVLSEALEEARAAGRPLLDLTVTNPTRCGFAYDTDALLRGLASPQAMHYTADPLGMPCAREAVAGYYAARGTTVDLGKVLLTASTSEAYGYLLKLLCDTGDELLVPHPSYPLFDLLGQLHDVRLVPYRLLLHDDWRIDLQGLRQSITPRTRAIVVVHPNNPTGHGVHPADRNELQALAAEFGLALIVDEVFLDFAVEAPAPLQSFAHPAAAVLTFVLSGLSKVLALPQMKLAWTVVCGPPDHVAEAMQRLELIADTFLSPNGPVQHALAAWLGLQGLIQAQIVECVRTNLETLDGATVGSLCRRLPVQAGWCALVRVPAVGSDEALALWLLHETGVVVHPGSFYGLPAAGWLVVSLIVPQDCFAQGVGKMVTGIAKFANGVPDLALGTGRRSSAGCEVLRKL